MSDHTITLYQYNQQQKNPKHKAVDKGVALPSECRPITRMVLGKGMVTFMAPAVLSPGLASRLVDMLKYNIECDDGYHKGEGNAKYTQSDFKSGVWSLAAIHPQELEVIDRAA